jgi:chromosome segregation ATPase
MREFRWIAGLGALVAWLVGVSSVGAQNDATLTARIGQLESLLADRDREIAQLRQYSQRLLEDLEETRDQLGTAERDGAATKKLRDEQESRHRRERIESQASLQKQIAARDRKLEKLRAEATVLREKAKELESLRSRFSQEIEKLDWEAQRHEHAIVARLSRAGEGWMKARMEIDRLSSEVAGLEASLVSERQSLETARTAAATLERELQASRAEGGRWLAELETRKREISELRGEVARRDDELGKRAEELAALRSATEDESDKLHSQVLTIESSFDAERQRREALEAEVRELRARNRELAKRAENAAPKPGAAEISGSVAVAAVALRASPDEESELDERRDVEAVRRENDALERRVRELRGEAAHARKLVERLEGYERRIRDLRDAPEGDELRKLEIVRDAARTELDRSRRSIQEIAGSIEPVAMDEVHAVSSDGTTVSGALESERRRRERLAKELGRIRSAAAE